MAIALWQRGCRLPAQTQGCLYRERGGEGNFRIKSGSLSQGHGAYLPTEVATAMGKSTGVNYDLGALHLTGAIDEPEPLPQPEERIGRFLVSERAKMIQVLQLPMTAPEMERLNLSLHKISLRGKTIAKWIVSTLLQQALDLQGQITKLTESELLEERGDATAQIAQLKEVNSRLSLALRLGYSFPS